MDEAGNTVIIIRFNDSEKASEFVRNVNAHLRATNYIMHVGFVSANDLSFSATAQLFSLLFIFL